MIFVDLLAHIASKLNKRMSLSSPAQTRSEDWTHESGASGHYDQLLSQVADLRKDFSRTVDVCKRLRAENDELRNSFRSVRCNFPFYN